MANTFKNAGGAVGVTPTTIYTCPASTQAVLHAVYLANVDGVNDATFTIEVYDSSATASYKIAYNIPLGKNSGFVFDKPINLEEADELRITASASGDIEAFASVLEVA